MIRLLCAAALLVMAGPFAVAQSAGQLKKAERSLSQAMQSGQLDDVAYWVEQIGSFKTPEALEIVLAVGEKYPQDPVRTSVREALTWARSSDSLRYFRKVLGSSKQLRRALLVVEALQAIEDPVTVEPLAEALAKTRDPRLTLSVVRALRHKESPLAVETCIAFYAKIFKDENLLWAETRITLLKLTGHDFTDPKDWTHWWLDNKEAWPPGQKRGLRSENQARTAVYYPPMKKGGLDLPKLFGQDIVSKRIVFVIDASSSMERAAEGSGEEGSRRQGRTRLQLAQSELARAIKRLRSDVRFNIIAFHTRVIPWQEDKLISATSINKLRAIVFVG
ncbi:MAG: hypothetical protein V3T77_00560, partial [Planctomycetota bacterium]